ncbi:MAG: thermonuclease family protein [Solirubrobacteraceae bacterium]|nr:thermonuclease family protein [Solirubrobacteraceae bacterium]
MSTPVVISTVLALIVAGTLISFITGIAVRLMILTAVLGGAGTVAALAGNAAGEQLGNLVDRVKDQAATLPVLGGAIADSETGGDRDVVVRVIDGDTVELRSTGRARLIGIDTPETVKRGHPVECHGPEASAATKQLLPTGTKVTVKRDREHQDHYGRELVYLFAANGRMVNGTLVREGHARTLRIEPNTRHARRLADLQADAKNARRGMWGRC